MKSADITNAEKGVFGLNFEHFSISPSGRYVTFLGIGWEWIIGTLYDANTHKILLELDSPSTFKVLPKEDRFLACTVDHFGGALYGDIYELPTGKKLFSLLDLDQMKKIQSQNLFIANLTCEDREDGTAIFTVLFDPEVMQTEVHRSLTVTVDTQTGAVKDVQEK